MKGKRYKAISTTNPHQLFKTANDGQLKKILENKHQAAHSNLDYLYKTMTQTVDAAGYIRKKYMGYKSNVEYPNSVLGKNLKLTARLINGGAETEVFYVSMGGFDTHGEQTVDYDPTLGIHASLLYHLSSAIKAFFDDMKILGIDQKVMAMTRRTR